jgi:hypothetical protein
VPEVAAVDHMIPGAGKLNAKSSSHRDRSARLRSGSEPALTPILGMPTIRRSLPPQTNDSRTDPVGLSRSAKGVTVSKWPVKEVKPME